MKNFKSKAVIVTGAAMGLGLAVAKELASLGANLSLVDYNAESLSAAQAELNKDYPNVTIITVVADVADEAAVKHYVDETVMAFGRVDGLYNNAGIEGKQAGIVEYDIAMFKKVIDINLMGVYYGMRYVIPVMQQQKYGRIVNAASVGGIRGVLNEMPYVASKHAVCGMTKNAALEYAKYGITTNAIAPGAILTPMVEEAFKEMNPKDPKAAETEYAASNPSKRLGMPEDVAKVVAFLLSEDCAMLMGKPLLLMVANLKAMEGYRSNGFLVG